MERHFRLEILGQGDWEYFNPEHRNQQVYPAAHLIPISPLAKKWVKLMEDPENWGLRLISGINVELQMSRIVGRQRSCAIRICDQNAIPRAWDALQKVSRYLATTVQEKIGDWERCSQSAHQLSA